MTETPRLDGLRFAILITSDRAARGERPDETAPLLKMYVEERGGVCKIIEITPDEPEEIRMRLCKWAVSGELDVILTSGGTGVGPRDATVDVTRELMDRETPGFGEEMRRRSMQITSHGIISRATAGVMGDVFILNLPGSPKGALECLTFVAEAMAHAARIMRGGIADCAVEQTFSTVK